MKETKNERGKEMLQVITANFEGTTRFDKMEGKQFLVASMIMLVEGVHEGSGGPLFYPAKEIKNSVPFWNAKPVVVYHPQRNGKFISACDPDILTNHGVGLIMNTKVGKVEVEIDKKKVKLTALKAEAWIDVDRANAVDDRIMEAVDNNEMMELSTGLVMNCDNEEGEWNDEEYIATVSNFHPDHLALLPDIQGACSIKDGAGFLRLNEAKDGFVLDVSSLGKKERKCFLKNKVLFVKMFNHDIIKTISNEISFDDTRQRLQSILREKFPDEDYIWIEDVFDDYVVYEKSAKLYKQEYEDVDGSISFKGIPAVVVKETNYVISNRKDSIMSKKKKVKKEDVVNGLIANEATLWEEEDKEDLMAMELSVLERMIPVEKEEEEDTTVANKKKEQEAVTNAANKGAEEANAENKDGEDKDKKPQTADEYIKNAPKEIQSMLRNGMDSYTTEKAKVIAFITENERCTFTKEQLEAKELSELKTLAELAANTEERKEVLGTLNNYSGQAEVVISDDDDEEPMVQPKVNWAEEAEKKRKTA